MQVTAKAPSDCSKLELQEFCSLVKQGGQVQFAGLQGRVLRAKKLIFLRKELNLAGVAAVKVPYEAYRNRVFKQAGCNALSALFIHELGWVFVEKDQRGRGYSKVLVKEALRDWVAAIYSTSAVQNIAMHKVLAAYNFQKSGKDYMSDGSSLRMFVRDAT